MTNHEVISSSDEAKKLTESFNSFVKETKYLDTKTTTYYLYVITFRAITGLSMVYFNESIPDNIVKELEEKGFEIADHSSGDNQVIKNSMICWFKRN